MNTPLHGLLAATLLDRRADAAVGWAAFAGGVAPDVPAAIFYAWYCLLGGQTGIEVWQQNYTSHAWELVADYSHSILLCGVVVGLAAWARWWPAAAFAGGMALHGIVDMATHADHAHRHFLPLTQWRLHMPWSTWDRAHGAQVVIAVEGVMLAVCAAVLWRRYEHPLARAGVSVMLLWWVYWVGSGRAFFDT